MIGRINPNIQDVTIIGAGISGLLSAYRLLKAGYTVIVHEKSNHSGGLIATRHTEFGQAETAAHSLRSSASLLALFDDLGTPYAKAKTSKKFIFRSGKLRGNPFSVGELFSTACFAFFKKSTGEDLSLAEWGRQHLGPASVDNMLVPLSSGIYAASPEELDQQLAFPRFTTPKGLTLFERIIKSKGPKEKSFVLSPTNGMGDLVDRLTQYITDHPKGRLVLNSDITALPHDGNVVIATSAAVAGQLIQNKALETLQYAPMLTATVFVDRNNIRDVIGIGTLMARDENKNILGILFNSATFDNRVRDDRFISLTVMMGGTQNPDVIQKSDHEIETIIKQELRRILDFKGDQASIHLTRWPHAIPLYSKELRVLINELNTTWCATAGHVLVGNYAGEVSIRGMCETSLALTNK